MAATTERGITTCWQNNGYHVYGAGPCLDRIDYAINYREDYDYNMSIGNIRWRDWPPKRPADWVNPKNDTPIGASHE